MERFTVIPTNLTPFKHTTVSPIFAEEWHIRPPAYDLYENRVPEREYIENKIDDPRNYPYAQYLTKTNLLPHDQKQVNLYCNGLGSARGYINSNFTQHDIAFRENMTRILKKKLQRRFRHECNDSFSPYRSF